MRNNKVEKYTTDLYELIKHTRTVIRDQKSSEKIESTRAVDLLHEIDLALTSQINKIEEMEVLHEGTQKTIKDKIAKAAGKVAGFIDSARDDAASKMLRDDYTALSMIASGYTMLHTAALGSDKNELANFSKDSLTRVAQLITETSRLLPHTVADELNIKNVAEQAEENTQRAWDPKNLPV